MKKTYNIPELEVALFATEDILTTSSNNDNDIIYPFTSSDEVVTSDLGL